MWTSIWWGFDSPHWEAFLGGGVCHPALCPASHTLRGFLGPDHSLWAQQECPSHTMFSLLCCHALSVRYLSPAFSQTLTFFGLVFSAPWCFCPRVQPRAGPMTMADRSLGSVTSSADGTGGAEPRWLCMWKLCWLGKLDFEKHPLLNTSTQGCRNYVDLCKDWVILQHHCMWNMGWKHLHGAAQRSRDRSPGAAGSVDSPASLNLLFLYHKKEQW